MSMIFYAWGEPRFLAVMLLEIITVWAGAIGIGIAAERGSERLAGLLTALTVSSLVIILAIFKYLDFIIENAIRRTGAELTLPGIVLPLGISFDTFQALSYAIDVRRGNVKAERNIYTVALYISLFPLTAAGSSSTKSWWTTPTCFLTLRSTMARGLRFTTPRTKPLT